MPHIQQLNSVAFRIHLPLVDLDEDESDETICGVSHPGMECIIENQIFQDKKTTLSCIGILRSHAIFQYI